MFYHAMVNCNSGIDMLAAIANNIGLMRARTINVKAVCSVSVTSEKESGNIGLCCDCQCCRTYSYSADELSVNRSILISMSLSDLRSSGEVNNNSITHSEKWQAKWIKAAEMYLWGFASVCGLIGLILYGPGDCLNGMSGCIYGFSFFFIIRMTV